ncbi:MAG: diguanylate cyclase [Pseudomonadota bacterium]
MNDMPQPRTGSGINQAEIARRALKTLAERKITPTPETFADVYYELVGARPAGASAVGVIKDVLKDLVRSQRIGSQEAAAVLERAQQQDWTAVRDAIDRALERRPGGAAGNWPHTAVALLRQADALHAGWTRARKLEAVMRVVDGAAEAPDVALERLQRLIESWGPALAPLPGARDDLADPIAVPTASAAPTEMPATAATARHGSDARSEAAAAAARAQADAWRQVALRSMRLLEQSCGEGTPAAAKLRAYAERHTGRLAPEDVDRLVARFTDAVREIDRQIAEEHKIRDGLQRLLALLCDNMKSLTPEEAWLAGQLEPIRALLGGPIRALALEQAEMRLAQIIAQQSTARRSLQEAKFALKEMLATLVERIGSMSSSTGRFYEQIGGYQKRLEGAADFETLSAVIQGLLADTQIVRDEIKHSREELVAARKKVETYEARVQQLEKELMQVSALVQKDPLTFALNRRGLEEAFRIETARAKRYGSALGFVMIDLDDFKKLNDSLGHIAGDRALVHVASLMQATVRPTDFIARLGGEEFALLLPATEVAEAAATAERLQRELAKRGFQFEGRPWTLTFSAGAVQWRNGESLEEMIRRADAALYEAKRSGKNRVVRAD